MEQTTLQSILLQGNDTEILENRVGAVVVRSRTLVVAVIYRLKWLWHAFETSCAVGTPLPVR